MTDVEIGSGKTARRAYALADVAVVPSRRTRDPEDVSLHWQLDAYALGLPILAAPSDAVVSPSSAVEIGQLAGLAVLDLEGLWARHDDPDTIFARVAGMSHDAALRELLLAREAPIRDELITARITEIKASGVVCAAALRPQQTAQHSAAAVRAGVDLLVVRGPVVSAEHVSSRSEPLDLKRFIADLDVPVVVGGCASFRSALHLMRTGAAGVLVGVGATGAVSVPLATAIADAAGARMRYLDESGGRYVHVLADGPLSGAADIARAIACGADAVMLGAALAAARDLPGRGRWWESRPVRVEEAVVLQGAGGAQAPGPDRLPDVLGALADGLRATMATTGYRTLKEFQKAEVVLTHP